MIPLVSAGTFTRIYDPSVGEVGPWYINDHCLIQGPDGQWHMFGITHAEPANPTDEKLFAHAAAANLTQSPWERQPFALSAEPSWDEVLLWAPHIVLHGGLYYMYYCAGDKDDTQYKIHLATSTDLWNWQRHPRNPMVRDGYHGRDPMVLGLRDEWLMYYTATSEPTGGNHIVACVRSRDLVNWTDRRTVFTHARTGTYGGPCESPFVVQRGEWFYLFAGPEGIYNGQAVYRSKDPFHFETSQRVGLIDAHASEVVQDVDGQWFVTHCGWGQGGLYLAPLLWHDGIDE